VAGYLKPGHLAVYKLGTKSPIFKIAPAELDKSGINDIDISKNRKYAFCGSGGIKGCVQSGHRLN
jgi:hypothetical protein